MTDRSHLASLVSRLSSARVLCVGDVMLDQFVHGSVERISPEAPIPVFRIEREESMLGGAGNVVRNLAALGAKTCFVSVVGDDRAGTEITRLVGEHQSVEPYLLVERARSTTIKTRYVAGGHQMLRADRETIAPVGESMRETMTALVRDSLDTASVVVFSDYGKGVLAPSAIERMISDAKSAGKPVIVDPKGVDYTRYRGVDLLTPNRRELAEATGMPVAVEAEIVAAARHLIATCGVGAVLVTRSQEGMSLVTPDGECHLPAEAREVFDVSGAGDTVLAALAAARAVGATLEEAARLANAAAGIVVGKVGTAVVHPAELTTALHHQDLAAGESKVATRDQAVDIVGRWRRRGLRVGFTNGCFDLLHPGHISLLEQARAACDRLVVGLNSDASVRRLKGEGRPVQSEAARGVVLASLASVDLVVIFEEDTPLALIEAFRPDVLVKGADYRIDQVVGADIVTSYGGRVLLADLVDGQSTTKTIARMTR